MDLGDALADDFVPPAPELLFRSDGRALLYLGRINALIGESGSGKSWISQAAIVQAITQDRNVLVVDLEDHAGSYVARLLALGLTKDQIRERLIYVSPEQALSAVSGAAVASLIHERDISLVVLDSTGEAMALQGTNPNEDDAVARWYRMLPRAIANLGPAVLLLDHLPKSADAPTGFAIGSQRKRAAIDGAMYRVEVGVAPVKGKTGRLRLVCAKDRSGNWQHGAQVAEVTIQDSDRGTRVALAIPPDPSRPTVLMARVSEYVAKVGTASRTQIAQNCSGKRDYLYKAIDVLVAEGYVQERARAGRGGGLEIAHLRPFTDEPDLSWAETMSSPPNPDPASGTGFAGSETGNYVFYVPHISKYAEQDIVPDSRGAQADPAETETLSQTQDRDPDPTDRPFWE
jgi:hypothetical protein